MSITGRLEKEPFRLFFPLGASFLFLGLLCWAVVLWDKTYYPVSLHRAFMINGFLLSFISGFVLTLAPRVIGAPAAQFKEIIRIGILVLLATLLGNAAGEFLYLGAGVTLCALVGFCLKRLPNKTAKVPHSAWAILFGLVVWGAVNFLLCFEGRETFFSKETFSLAKEIFLQGAPFSLVLALSASLFPEILGWEKKATKPMASALGFSWMIFWGSYFLSPFIDSQLVYLLRFVVVLFYAIFFWRLYRRPKARSFFAWGLWLSLWCFLIHFGARYLWVTGGVHAQHGAFISVFCLLMLLLSLRLLFIGEPETMTKNGERKALLSIFLLVIVAMLTRVTAVFLPKVYITHLGYAALILISALFIWLTFYYRTYSHMRKG